MHRLVLFRFWEWTGLLINPLFCEILASITQICNLLDIQKLNLNSFCSFLHLERLFKISNMINVHHLQIDFFFVEFVQ